MRIKQLKLIVVLLLGFGPTGLHAQSMYVKESNGTQTAYILRNIRNMSFSSGNLTIIKTDNSRGVYVLNGLRYLNFSTSSTGLDEQILVQKNTLIAYPNPATNVLNIDLSGAFHQEGILRILNYEGKTVISRKVSNESVESFDISHLPNGIYLCCYIISSKIKVIKIIKQ